jgi:hypothetical protein
MSTVQFPPSPTRVEDIRLFTLPAGGMDKLKFKVLDTISIPGMGTDTVELTGTFTIRRSDPSSPKWGRGTIDVEMVNLSLHGKSDLLGEARAKLNPARKTVGRVEAAGGSTRAAGCRFAAYIVLELVDHGLAVFNKTAVPLTHTITHVPPIGQGGGTIGRVAIRLYDLTQPAQAMAVLRKVSTEIGTFVSTRKPGTKTA